MGGDPPHDTDRATVPSLVDRAHASIREGILSGVHPPHSRLRVSALATENGVSPIPVREALRRLEAERLVVIERNRGATVAPISVEDMLDIYETRIVVECHALRRAHARFSEADLDRAEKALAAMTSELRAGHSRAVDRHHRTFHFALYFPSSSPWSMHVIEQLWSGAERYLRLSAALRATPEEFAAEHEAVLAAVREGGPDAAADRLERHLRRTAALLEQAHAGYAEDVPT